MRTSSNLPVRVFTTRTREPNGRCGCAAVRASLSKISPLAVLRPLKPGPYQLALPTQALIALGGWLKCATRGASIAGATRKSKGTQRSAAQITKSRFLIVLFLCYSFQKSVAGRGGYVNDFVMRLLLVSHLY